MDVKTILLVEDNPSDVNLTKRALSKNKDTNELVVARDGQEALDYLFATGAYSGRDISKQPVLILLDLRLPKIDGLSVIDRIKGDDRTKRIPTVVLTTSNEERDLATAYDLGVNSYLRKPVDFNEFTEMMSGLVAYWLVTNQPPPSKA